MKNLQNPSLSIKYTFLAAIIFLLIFNISVSSGTTYYVATYGNDTNNGTSLATPFRTIQKAFDVVQPGDQVYIRGGRYFEKPRLRRAGTPTQRILISAYGDEVPMIDGTKEVGSWNHFRDAIYRAKVISLETISGHPNYGKPIIVGQVIIDLVKLTQVNTIGAMFAGSFYQSANQDSLYVWSPTGDSPANHMVGIIKDFTSSYDWSEPMLLRSYNSDYVTFRGIVVQHSSSYGCLLKGNHMLVSRCIFRFISGHGANIREGTDNEISDSEVYETVMENWPRNPNPAYPWGAALVMDGGTYGRVLRNRVHHNHGEGITLGGTHVPVYAASYMLVQDNIVYNNYSVQIYLHGAHHCRVDRNFCYNTADMYNPTDVRTIPGITIGLESLHPEYGNLESDTLTNNIVLNSNAAFQYFRDAPTGLKNFYVANNAFVNFKWVAIRIAPGDHMGNIIRNNIIYRVGKWNLITIEDADDTIFDYTCFYNTAGNQLYSWNGVSYYSINSWRTGSGQGANSFFANPKFRNPVVTHTFADFQFVDVDPASYDLLSDSPCRDTGQTIPFVNWDYWGLARPQGVGYDIGASEYPLSAAFIKMRAWLQGPFMGSVMRTSHSAMLPQTSPYNADPRTVAQVPANAVDWVLLELRSTDRQTVVKDSSLFLREDGYLMDESANTRIALTGITEGDYYVTLKHRNHLLAMSSLPIHFSIATTTEYDFTLSNNQYYDQRGCSQLSNGGWGLAVGDINQDGYITSKDYVIWYNQNHQGLINYQPSDLNLDATLDSQDFLLWWENANKGSCSLIE